MIELSRRGSIATLTMAYGKANAMDVESCDAIATQFDKLREAPERAVVLTGQGGIFSAGVNLLKLSDGGVDYVRRFLPALHRLFETVFFFPKPVIAAVNGHAIAGGCVLECCADKRIAAAGPARIGVTELLVGVPFPPMAFEVMRFATAPQYFADGMLSGATFTPDVALTRGLVDQVVEPSELLDRALAAAETLAALPPATFRLTKQQLRQSVTDAMERHGARVAAVSEEIWTSAVTLDRVRDYVAKTLKKA
jgi:enoyl-CoA hydratase